MVVASNDNKIVKHIKKLREKKYRQQYQEFIIETMHLVEEAKNAGILKQVIVTETTEVPFEIDKIYVTDSIMKGLSELESPSNMIGICKMKDGSIKGNRLFILDDIQDPGNLGTIIRSAVAFSVDTLILGSRTVDQYNSKVLRASQGMSFHLNIVRMDLIPLLPELKKKGYQVIGTDVSVGKQVKDISFKEKYAIIVGNEGNGINSSILQLCDEKIYIRMNKQCESLNAGVAASIILYELDKEK